MQAENLGNNSMFLSKLFPEVKPSYALSASIYLPYVTINPGYLESYNHVPRKEAAVPPHMPVCGGMGGGSYLYNCSEKDMSDEQSLKMWKIYLINRDLKNGRYV